MPNSLLTIFNKWRMKNLISFFRKTHQRLFTQNGGVWTVGNLSGVGHHQTGKSIVISCKQMLNLSLVLLLLKCEFKFVKTFLLNLFQKCKFTFVKTFLLDLFRKRRQRNVIRRRWKIRRSWLTRRRIQGNGDPQIGKLQSIRCSWARC
jgi:uncharacterized protein YehS (DUF1456 family)